MPQQTQPVLPELLAPAGDFARLRVAVQYGADAVYVGTKRFGMRASSPNFKGEELAQAVEHCHQNGVKLFLTCNTLPRNDEVEALPELIANAVAAKVDALIVADIGVLMLARRLAPQLPIHISTQAGVVNYLAATELYHLGASRVVLARELSLQDIAAIRANTPPALELEVFVHGAMCVSFSGRCLLSQYLVGRDANHGECSQPCRWGYHLMEEKRPGQFFPIFEDERGTYILNAQDLMLLPYLDQLAQAGVSSFKVEGRAKSDYYVAVVTNAYRLALEEYRAHHTQYTVPPWLLEELGKVSHRQYCSGFLFPHVPPAQYYNEGYVREWDVMATVDGYRDGRILCTEKNRFGVGDTLELLLPGQQPVVLQVQELYNEEGQPIATARHPMMQLQLPWPTPVPPGAMLRRAR